MLIKKIFRSTLFVILFIIVIMNEGISALAAQSYNNYEYTQDNYNGMITNPAIQSNPLPAPNAMIVDKVVNHVLLNTQQLINPSDFCFDSEGNMYILDAGTKGNGNGRIIVVNNDMQTIKFIATGFIYNNQTVSFFEATSIFVSDSGLIYVTFTDKSQVAILKPVSVNKNYNLLLVKMIISPDVSKVQQNFTFKPIKIVADNSGKMYIANQGSFNGLMSLDAEGNFMGFIGANRVTINLWDYFWKSIATKAQNDARLDYIPIEFSSVGIDKKGFLYVTVRGNESDINQRQAIIESKVRKLNQSGDDILYQTGDMILGDRTTNITPGKIGSESNFIDVCSGDYGVFYCLDSTRGRVFAYDQNSKQLFVVGGLSNQVGCFKNPVAVKWNNGNLFVLDSDLGQITEFKLTEYGKDLLNGVMYSYQSEYDKAAECFSNVLKLNANNETALIGVGESFYSKGEYKQAMQEFLLGGDKQSYSKAFVHYRTIIIGKVVIIIGPIIFVVIVLLIVYKLFQAFKRSKDRYKYFREQAKKHNLRNHC